MVKKLAAYGVIAAGATALMLGSAPAQASDHAAATSPYAANPYGSTETMGGSKWSWDWKKVTVAKKQSQAVESNQLLYLCDIHILGLDHLAQGKNEENGKCANGSYNASQ